MMKNLATLIIAVAIVPLAIADCGPSPSGNKGTKDDGGGTTTTGAATDGTGSATGFIGGGDTGGLDASGTTDGGTTETKPGDVCVPNAVKCFGTAVLTCNVDGSDWKTTSTCNNGEICNTDSGGCICAPQCAGKACGPDACGGSCGSCPAEATCSEAGQCKGAAACVAAGTGIMPGDKVKNVKWTDENGQTLELHSLCGTAKATLAVETAQW
jgi:hypothetical protein